MVVMKVGNMRWKEIGVAAVAIAGVVSTNMGLLHFSSEMNDLITLIALVILAVNHSVVKPKE